jgi:hypothetical protein
VAQLKKIASQPHSDIRIAGTRSVTLKTEAAVQTATIDTTVLNLKAIIPNQ